MRGGTAPKPAASPTPAPPSHVAVVDAPARVQPGEDIVQAAAGRGRARVGAAPYRTQQRRALARGGRLAAQQ